MSTNRSSSMVIPFMLKKAIPVLLMVPLVFWIPGNHFLYAQSYYEKLWIEYNDHLISISTNDADLKNVLLKIADKANIHISVPVSLEKKVTISANKITLRKAFKRLLSGLNYAIIYSKQSRNHVAVSEVHVFTTSNKPNIDYSRIQNKINALERKLISYQVKLSEIDVNSRRGKRYLTRIRNIESNLKKLERQLN